MATLAEQVHHLLPLQGLDLTFRCTQAVTFKPFHNPYLSRLLRTVLDKTQYDHRLITLDAPENGRTQYAVGARYCFTVLTLAGAEPHLHKLYECLNAAARQDLPYPFARHMVLENTVDHFSGQVYSHQQPLQTYDEAAWQKETLLWMETPQIKGRWLQPGRLHLRPEQQTVPCPKRANRKGSHLDSCFCRDGRQLDYPLLYARLQDALSELLKQRHITVEPYQEASRLSLSEHNNFWVDVRYQHGLNQEQRLGGLLGQFALPKTKLMTSSGLSLWVLGQYIGMGQKRAFGNGQYRLENPQGHGQRCRAEPASGFLLSCMAKQNVHHAYRKVLMRAKSTHHSMKDQLLTPLADTVAWSVDDSKPVESFSAVHALAKKIIANHYRVAPLHGAIIEKTSGSMRPLTIPSFAERVLQRAVAHQLEPVFESLFSHASYGYRPSRSREQVAAIIQQSYEAGFRWVFESDIADFFGTVNWTLLQTRLQALINDTDLTSLVMSWISAPVHYQKQTIERHQGLPQGSPLSPQLANLVLDTFDQQVEAQGFRLIRYADDFIILCRDKAQAKAAAKAAEQALEVVGLRLNREKTHIRSFAEGFHYLGYWFVEGLALDVGQKLSDKENADVTIIPPYSWLAALADKAPRLLKQIQSKAKEAVVASTAPVSQAKKSATATQPEPTQGAMVFVSGAHTLLRTQENQLVLVQQKKRVQSIPWQGIQGIVLMGPHEITTPALREAMSHRISVHFANTNGRYQGSTWPVEPAHSGWQLWRLQEDLLQDEKRCLALAKSLIEARIRHQREVLRQRDCLSMSLNQVSYDSTHDDEHVVSSEASKVTLQVRIDQLLRRVMQVRDMAGLRGLEGMATQLYFAGLRAGAIPKDWSFERRDKKPPQGPVNALLSLGYTCLYSVTDTLLRADGLLPWIGVLHRTYGRHCALASDFMEPFRHIVERTVLTMINRGQITRDDFEKIHLPKEVWLKPKARQHYLRQIMQRFDEPVVALHDNTARSIYQHLHQQNQGYIRWLRGHQDDFKAFKVR